MSNFKETAVYHVQKEILASFKNDSGFKNHIVKHLSSELVERLISILEYENEIIVKQSDLRVEEYIPTNSVEYRRDIKWSPLVRCKDCKWHLDNTHTCTTFNFCGMYTRDDFYCADGKRREE